ncbi:probable disease resistance protein At4g27220 [Neltuma alba]|uniref:probable disease resistance protein At4g27220 n=1 Tax=Neltuma alba TaxID=207710 RepID=UPI0010A58541|nr:probable disease resistance protein At4g27220 [Prosopis alba]
MAEVGVSIVSEIVKKLVDAAVSQARYLFCFSTYVKELEREKENLQSKIESVTDLAKESAKKTEKIVRDVDKWLYKADYLIARVVELEENAMKRNKTPCLLHRGNFIRHYNFARQLEEKSKEIRRHSEVQFAQFSRLATLIGMNYFASQGFLHFDSRQRAYNELLEALKDDQVRMIGLHGMGGCGKTMLVKQVGQEAEQFFDKVVFVVVSNVIDVKKIQGQIAGQLSLELKEEEESERARRVFMRLRSGKRFLIILDDVWEMLDFKSIGILDVENQSGCTVLITTRKFDVCRLMNCKQTISLKGLDENEAWTLFQKHAGSFEDNSSTLKGLGKEITKQCDGLPIAIVALANALKGKTQIEWVEALETLRDSSWVEIEDNLRNIYACLRLSYDNLKDEVAKSLFLFCAVFPQDYEIIVDQLVLYGIGLGLVESHSYERARNQLIKAKTKLIDCCLLLQVSGKPSIKMHDLVRDVALWMAKKQIKLVPGHKWSPNAFQEDMITRDMLRYLWINKMDKLSHKLECPELEFLLISVKSQTPIVVANDFFEEHKNLRLLDIERCHILMNPYKVIGRCGQLKEFIGELLYRFGGKFWGFLRQKLPITRSLYVEEFETCISNATIKDLMQRAEVLSLGGIHESCKNIIPDVFKTIGGGMHSLTQLSLCFCDKIECVIDIGNHLGQLGIISRLTHLTIKEMNCLKTLCHGQPPSGLFANLEVLDICGCHSLQNIVADEGTEIVVADSEYQMTFPKLKTLIIYQCTRLEYLMPNTFAQSLTHLEVLDIRRANKLTSLFVQSIHEEPSPENFQLIEFCALSYLSLNNLPNIISICQGNYHPTWPSLKSLNLGGCPQLDLRSINYWLAISGLRQKDYETSEELYKAMVTPLETLQSLIVQNTKIEVIFDGEGLSNTEQRVASSLHYLRLHELPKLSHIWKGPKDFLLLQNLGKLIIQECRNLKVIFPTSASRCLQQLRELDIKKCEELEEIIEDESLSPSNPHPLVFPNLSAIFIRRCHKLKHVIPISTSHVLPKIRILFIHGASEVEKIFRDEEGETREIRKENLIPNLEYVILWQLPKLNTGGRWIDLRTVRYLLVQQCPRLNITSTITPRQLQQILDNEKAAYWDDRWELKFVLEDIIESNEKCSRQMESLSSSHAQNNKQNLTPIASPKSAKNVEESRDEKSLELNIAEEMNVQGSIESENVKIVASSAHSEATSSLIGSSTLSIALQHNKKESKVQTTREQNISKEKSVQGRVEEGTTSRNVQIFTTVAHLEPASLAKIQSEIKFNPRELDIDKDGKLIPLKNLQDYKDDDLISFLQSMEDHYGRESPFSAIRTVATDKDELVAKALVDLKDYLKMPLRDIAASEANSLRLQTALNFLSRLSLEDIALSHGVKALIKSMHKDFPSIISCFKQAFATANEFVVLKERDKRIKEELTQRKEAAIALVSRISKTQKSMVEARAKKARLKEHITWLDKEITDYEVELSRLQEQKRKCIAENIEFMKEIEVMRKESLEMVEDQTNARQEVFQIDHKWSVMCSQFELAMAQENLS